MYGSKYVLLYSTAEHCWWWQTDLISFDYIGLSIASVVDQLHKSPLWRIQDIKNWLLVLHNTKFKILQLWRGKGGHFEFELIRTTASLRKASVLSVLLLQACLSQTVCTTPKNIFKVEGVENLVSHSTYSPSRISHKGLLMPQSGELRGHWRHLSLFRCKKKKNTCEGYLAFGRVVHVSTHLKWVQGNQTFSLTYSLRFSQSLVPFMQCSCFVILLVMYCI